MKASTNIFEIENKGHTIIVTPVADLRELAYPQIEAGAAEVLRLLNQPPDKDVIVDFQRTDYYGSTALGFFLKVWKRVKSANRNLAFCNVSDHEMEILRITKLDHVWPIYASREEALRAMDALACRASREK